MKDDIRFDADNLNVDDILTQVYDRLEQRGYNADELRRLNQPLEWKSIPQPTTTDEFAAQASALSYVQVWWPMPKRGGVLGGIKTFVQKVTRKLNFFYMKHVFNQQNQFNTATATALTQISDRLHEAQEQQARIAALEVQLTVQKEQADAFQLALSEQKQHILSLEEENHSLRTHFAQLSDQVSHQISNLDNRLSSYTQIAQTAAFRLGRVDQSIKGSAAPEDFSPIHVSAVPAPEVSESRPVDFDYFLFESRFRGSCESIKEKQRSYLPYFDGAQGVVLDIGCGRGEFLELLSEQGIACKGVDLSEENVDFCTAKGLPVELTDAIAYLGYCEDNSLGGIFSAQVIEHMSMEVLLSLLHLAKQKLRPGAPLILETLNPKCLMIYAESMYADPSHTKPVYPDTLQFMAQAEGFSTTELLYMTPSDPKCNIPMIDQMDELNHSTTIINNLLFGNREYALVAYK